MHIDRFKDVQHACRFCLMCRHICTVGNHTFQEVDTPRAKGLLLQNIERGLQEIDPELGEVLYRCCLCGYCKQWCVSGFDVPELVKAARRDLIENGIVPKNIAEIKESLIKNDNPYGKKPGEIDPELREYAQCAQAKAGTVLFQGAAARYMQPDTAIAAIKVLQKANADVTVLEDEQDSGFLLNALGFYDEAQQKARALLERLAGLDAKQVVVLSSQDYYFFTNIVPTLELDTGGIEFIHISQKLAGLIRSGVLRPSKESEKTYTYHDGAYMARFASVMDEPRVVLESVVDKMAVMNWSRELAHSAGEGLTVTQPEISLGIAVTRLEEAKEKGADVIVVSCPECKESLKRATSVVKGVEVSDLSELLLANL